MANFHKEENRLATFKNWTVPFINPGKLAMIGFFWPEDSSDIVKCYFCGVKIGAWVNGDDVLTEHQRWSQECPLIRRRRTKNVPLDIAEIDKILPPKVYDACACFCYRLYNISKK